MVDEVQRAINTIFQGAAIARRGAQLNALTILEGAELSAQGLALQSAGFRSSIKSVQAATDFNLKVEAINNSRRATDIVRSAQRTIGGQVAAQAASGLSLASKSFRQVQAESATFFERQLKNLAVDARNKRTAVQFEANVRKANLENQARAAEFQAKTTRLLAARRAEEALVAGDLATIRAQQRVNTLLNI